MAKIYLPTDLYNQSCKVINGDYIRVYTNSSNTQWQDVYFKNDYILKSGSSNYSNTVNCDSLNTYTDNIIYRYDFVNIVLLFIMLCIVIFWLPLKILRRMFRRWI